MPTDIQRIVLGVSVFAMGYLLVLQWNKDYQPAPVVSEAPVTSPAGGPLPPQASQPSLPPQPQAQSPAAGDAPPDAWLDAPAPVTATITDAPVAPSAVTDGSSLIWVTTDTQRVTIDLNGGAIVDLRLLQYPIALETPDQHLPLFESSAGRIYVAQSGLVGPDGPDSQGPPRYATTATTFDLGDADELVVPLTWSENGLRITRSYRFVRDSYRIALELTVENQRDTDAQGALYAQIKRDAARPVGEVSMFLGPQPWLGGAVVTPDDPYEAIDFDDMDEGRFVTRNTGGWIAMVQHYFVSAWVPGAQVEHQFYGERMTNGLYRLGFIGPPTTIPAGDTVKFDATLFAGPKIKRRLDATAPNLGLTVDYGILYWVAEPIFWGLSKIQSMVGNWGVAIILLTFAIKLILYPLSEASYRSLAGMKKVGPEMQRLQQRYKEDRPKLQQEMMALYKKEKVNPFGGCLPILLQMPVFIALYWVLYEAVELRQTPFFLWIVDLSVMDPFFILPILMGASMYVMQLLNPPPPDPVQAQVMRAMPIAFTFLFLFFPAGLVLYWLVNNVLSIAQQWVVTRRITGASATSAKK